MIMTNAQRNKEIEDLKNIITNIFLGYNNLTSKSAIDNRNSDDIINYKKQKNIDNTFLISIRNNALLVFDKCNDLLKDIN